MVAKTTTTTSRVLEEESRVSRVHFWNTRRSLSPTHTAGKTPHTHTHSHMELVIYKFSSQPAPPQQLKGKISSL